MDGLVVFLALLDQHLLCDVQEEGMRKRRDSTHNSAERKTEVAALVVEWMNKAAGNRNRVKSSTNYI